MATAIEPLTERWTDLPGHPTISRLERSPHRFNVVPAGRRSLKTETRKRKVLRCAIFNTTPWGEQLTYPGRWFLAAPTRDQAKRIFWDDLKQFSPRWAVESISETALVVRYKLGGEVHVVGMDKPERIEGSPWDGGVLDEYANMKAHTWGAHVRPALADRNGWCDLIGVPEGRNHYYDRATAAEASMLEEGDASAWGLFTWKSADILPADEIEAARRDLDPLTFEQEYEASFVNFAGACYYQWGTENKAALRERYRPGGELVLCFDFNVAPGTATIVQELDLPNDLAGTAVLGEVWIPQNSNTEAVCDRIVADWGEHRGRISVYGDATGGARGTAKTSGSDWDLVKRKLYAHFGASRVHMRVPKSNPAERARVNALNTRLCIGAGERRLIVDPTHCPRTVRDFEGVRVLEGGSGEIDKRADPELSHLTDGLGYYVYAKFPTHEREITSHHFPVT